MQSHAFLTPHVLLLLLPLHFLLLLLPLPAGQKKGLVTTRALRHTPVLGAFANFWLSRGRWDQPWEGKGKFRTTQEVREPRADKSIELHTCVMDTTSCPPISPVPRRPSVACRWAATPRSAVLGAPVLVAERAEVRHVADAQEVSLQVMQLAVVRPLQHVKSSQGVAQATPGQARSTARRGFTKHGAAGAGVRRSMASRKG